MTEEEWRTCENPIQMLLSRFPNRLESFRIRFEGERSRRHIRRLAERALESPDGRKYHDILLAIIAPKGKVISLKRRCDIIRCMIPYQPQTLNPSWLTSTVISLAEQIYESRDFSAMPILADALMDAGCSNETILEHCRGPGPHVRGCWVCDLCLIKS
jgi:hypothetical protein